MNAIARLIAAGFSCGCAALSWAQNSPVPPPVANPGQAAAATISDEIKKPSEIDNARPQERISAGGKKADPGFKPPMDIRIRGEGIGMPKCATESREGEACK